MTSPAAVAAIASTIPAWGTAGYFAYRCHRFRTRVDRLVRSVSEQLSEQLLVLEQLSLSDYEAGVSDETAGQSLRDTQTP